MAERLKAFSSSIRFARAVSGWNSIQSFLRARLIQRLTITRVPV